MSTFCKQLIVNILKTEKTLLIAELFYLLHSGITSAEKVVFNFYLRMGMKFLAFILTFYFGCLIVQPTVNFISSLSQADEECCTDQCCEADGDCEESPCDQQSSNGCCPGGICNPFESCACCFGYTLVQLTVETAEVELLKSHLSPTSEQVELGVNSDCFHPPEVV